VTRRQIGRAEIVGVGVTLGVFAAVTLVVIVLDRQYTWDESLYATKTRALVTEIPSAYWGLFRPPGLTFIGLAALPVGLGDVSLRVASAVCGILAVGLAWGLARILWGALAGGIALLAVIASPIVLAQVARFHNDLPVVAPILALMVLLWWQLEEREEPGWPLLAVGPLAASAFYLRYGALAILVGVGVTATLLWWQHAIRHPRLVGATLLLAVALFVPHVIDAVGSTGSPLGIIRSAVTAADTSSPLQSAWRYIRWAPTQLFGVTGLLMGLAAVGYSAVAVACSIRARRPTPAARRLAWLLLPAAVAAMGTVIVSHAEPRYVLAPVVLVEIAGAGGVAAAVRGLPARWGGIEGHRLRLMAPLMLSGMVAVVGLMGVLWIRSEVRAGRVQWLAEAGRSIADDARGDCAVVSTMPPILSWYSGCVPLSFSDPMAARSRALQGEAVYVVLTSDDARRADPARLASYRHALTLEPVAATGSAEGWAETYRILP
jgi:hypothetical protein